MSKHFQGYNSLAQPQTKLEPIDLVIETEGYILYKASIDNQMKIVKEFKEHQDVDIRVTSAREFQLLSLLQQKSLNQDFFLEAEQYISGKNPKIIFQDLDIQYLPPLSSSEWIN